MNNDIYPPVNDVPPEIIAAAKMLYNWMEMHNVKAFDGVVNRKKYEELSELYHELIFNVMSCFENDTRHQTALRYIKQMEKMNHDCGESQEVK